MNEPHDLDAFGGMASWTKQVQAAVNAIRAAGAKTQPILLSGTGWTGAADFLGTNLPSLKTVTDPVGGTSLLWFDIHQCKSTPERSLATS
jgi:endoglucanase